MSHVKQRRRRSGKAKEMPETRYLQKRRQTWYVRVAVPPTLQKKIGKQHVLKSLQTRDLAVARDRRWAAITEIKKQFSELKGNKVGWLPDGIDLTSFEREQREWFQSVVSQPTANLRTHRDHDLTDREVAASIVEDMAEEIEDSGTQQR